MHKMLSESMGDTMYNSNYYDWYRQNDKLISDIEKAINGEYSAISAMQN